LSRFALETNCLVPSNVPLVVPSAAGFWPACYQAPWMYLARTGGPLSGHEPTHSRNLIGAPVLPINDLPRPENYTRNQEISTILTFFPFIHAKQPSW
jgi:hypothetical protein